MPSFDLPRQPPALAPTPRRPPRARVPASGYVSMLAPQEPTYAPGGASRDMQEVGLSLQQMPTLPPPPPRADGEPTAADERGGPSSRRTKVHTAEEDQPRRTSLQASVKLPEAEEDVSRPRSMRRAARAATAFAQRANHAGGSRREPRMAATFGASSDPAGSSRLRPELSPKGLRSLRAAGPSRRVALLARPSGLSSAPGPAAGPPPAPPHSAVCCVGRGASAEARRALGIGPRAGHTCRVPRRRRGEHPAARGPRVRALLERRGAQQARDAL